MKQAKGIVDASPPDPEASTRKDLTHLKIYAVDSEDTMEVWYAQRQRYFRGMCRNSTDTLRGSV